MLYESLNLLLPIHGPKDELKSGGGEVNFERVPQIIVISAFHCSLRLQTKLSVADSSVMFLCQ